MSQGEGNWGGDVGGHWGEQDQMATVRTGETDSAGGGDVEGGWGGGGGGVWGAGACMGLGLEECTWRYIVTSTIQKICYVTGCYNYF